MSQADGGAETAHSPDSRPALVLLQAAAAQAGIGSFARRSLESPQAVALRYRAAAQLLRRSGSSPR